MAAESPPAAATSTPTPAPAPPANMPAVLNREPSQQDLEIARQLQSFQSQGVPAHEEAARLDAKPQTQQQAQTQAPAPSLSRILSDDQQQGQQVEDGQQREAQQEQQGQQGQQQSQQSQQQQHQPQQQQSLPASPYQPVAQFTPLQQPQQQPQQQQQQQRTPQPSNVSGGGGGQICSNCGTTKTPLWRRSPTGAVICNACGLYYKARQQMRPVGLKRGAAATSYSPDGQPQERGTSPNAIQGGATYVSADNSCGTCPGGGRCNGTGGHEGCSGCPAYNNRISKTAQVALRQASHEPGQGPRGEGSAPGPVGAVQQSVMIACQNCGTTITPLWRRDEAGNTICNACGLYHKLHGHHRPVQMKKAEIKRRKRVVPNHLGGADDQASVYTNETAEEEHQHRHSIPPPTEIPSPPFTHADDSKPLAGGPIPVDFTDTFRSRKPPSPPAALGAGEPRPSPNPRKRSFSAATQDHQQPPHPHQHHQHHQQQEQPYPHAQNMTPTSDDNIDPALPTPRNNREPSIESAAQGKDRDARRAALQAEAEKMRRMLEENERELAALGRD